MLNIPDPENQMDISEPNYDKILQKQDFFPKIFLIPSEICLDKQQGIKVIKRSRNRPDKYIEERVRDITIDQQQIRNKSFNNPQQIDHPAGHGLLSLFKRTPTRRIKLAICICVYSEPKYMLKNTIKGIQQSYKHFLNNAGILPHEIILTVIFDGIQKLNNSKDQTQNMISFFHEIDLKNGFVRQPYGKSLDEYFKDLEQKNFHLSRLQEEKPEDFNLFTGDELEELQFKLFQNQYNEYMRIKNLLVEIQELKKKKNIKLDSLPIDIYKKYEEVCTNFCIQNNLYYQTQQQIQQYLQNKRNIKVKLIFQAISEMENLCNKYLESRQDKSIIYPVRLETDDFLNPKLNPQEQLERAPKQKKQKEYNYMFFVVKHKNQGKLSSHMLFFEGLCKLFDPEYCMLTDVGMKPHEDAVFKMWQHMQLNPKCGGVCGYMNLKMQSAADDLGYREDGFVQEQVGSLTKFFECFISVQRAQQFEYHFAHMLDKPFESAFRYIHVLPGAFSAYRWKALKSLSYDQEQPEFRNFEIATETDRNFSDKSLNEYEEEETLMKRYLKTASISHNDADKLSLQDSNMYLAEDRIMCLGIHALGYDLEYLPDAESSVDPVTSLTRLLGQRRRWINGSWFAFNYVRGHVHERTTFIFLIQIIFYTLVQILAWLGPALFFIAMNLTLVAAVRQYVVPIFLDFFSIQADYQLDKYRIGIFNIKNVTQSIPDLINYVYILLVFSVVLFSILVNNNNTRFKRVYYMASTAFGIYGIIIVALLVYNAYEIIFRFERQKHGQENFIIPVQYLRIIILFIIGGHALPILWSFSFKKSVQCLASVFSYIYYVPTYINILQIFAFCRIDDLSWGTKGLDNDGEGGIARQWERRKYVFVLQYVGINVIFSYIIITISDYDILRNVVILVTTCLVAFLLAFRLLAAGFYLISYYLVRLCCKKLPEGYANRNLSNGRRILNALKEIQLKTKQIEKKQVKKKKEEQYQKGLQIVSQINTSLNGIGPKIRSRVAQHMISHNVFSKKDMSQKKPKKKISLRKKLKIVEEASIEESQESNSKNQKSNYNLVIPEAKKQTDIKSKIKALKDRRKNGK